MLFNAMLGESNELVMRVRKAVQARLPAYRELQLVQYDNELGLEIRRVLQCARAGRAPLNGEKFEDLAAVGEARAQQGVPLADMLQSWHIATEVTVCYAREVGKQLGIGGDEVLEFVESALLWADVAIATTSEAHRKAELSLVHMEEVRRAAFVREILYGTVSPVELRTHVEEYGIDPLGEYTAVRARASDRDSTHKLAQALGFNDGMHGFSALVDGDIAGFLIRPPRRDVDGVVGYGPPRPLDRLADSYRLAARALMTAWACGLSGAHDISSLGLRAAVAMDVDVGESLRKRYLEPLEKPGSAGELIATLRAYLACGMHVERTATRLHVHQNTVRYRLARFEELTGASLHDAEVLFEAWWALELSTMTL
jgi:hypothetical protein